MDISPLRGYYAAHTPTLMGERGGSAVLVPLVRQDGEYCLLYEIRSASVRQPGEVCFPGGKREAGETAIQCALRETWEEIGIPPEEIRVLAPLDLMQDISDRVVYPFLAEISAAGAARLKASAAEVKNVFFVPVDYLLNCKEEVYRYVVSAKVDDDFPYERIGFPKTYPWRKGYMNVPIYEYQGHFIWGMTGRMVRWFLQQLRQMEQQEGKA